jgi:hypothetical protein
VLQQPFSSLYSRAEGMQIDVVWYKPLTAQEKSVVSMEACVYIVEKIFVRPTIAQRSKITILLK